MGQQLSQREDTNRRMLRARDEMDRRYAEPNYLPTLAAIEHLFNVKVRDVRTMQYRGKERRLGKFVGRRAGWKKAVVKLREGDSIEIFEGV